MPRHRTGLLFAFAALVIALSTFGANQAHGQAIPAAQRTVGYSVFGGYEHALPDYGQGYDTNNGGVFGVDYTRFLSIHRVNLGVSAELRANLNFGYTVSEKSYLGGIKVEKGYGRYHPYGDFLLGLGNIHFNNYPFCCGSLGDNGIVYSPGAGVDVDVARNLQAKVDFQLQNWNLGDNFTLSPDIISVGIKYNLPARGLRSRRRY